MNKEIYVSWCKRLIESQEALQLLKDSPYVAGIETSDYGGEEEKFQEAGLRVSIHNPVRSFNTDLTDDNFIDILAHEDHEVIIQFIKEENAPVVGFHACHRFSRLQAKIFSNEGVDEPIDFSITANHDLEALTSRVINNLLKAEELINKDVPDDKKRKVLFETAIFYDLRIIFKRDFVSEQEKTLTNLLDFFTSPGFIRKVLEHPGVKANGNIGFLFDISHIYVTAHSKMLGNDYKGSEDDYINEIINAAKGKIYQVHINVPDNDEKKGLADKHCPITPGEPISEKVLFFVREVLKQNPEISTITLEMEAGDDALSHAKILAEQAELVAKKLGFEA